MAYFGIILLLILCIKYIFPLKNFNKIYICAVYLISSFTFLVLLSSLFALSCCISNVAFILRDLMHTWHIFLFCDLMYTQYLITFYISFVWRLLSGVCLSICVISVQCVFTNNC